MNKEFLSREALSARVRSNREAKSPVASEKQDRGFRRFSQKPLIVREFGEASAADSLGLYRQILYKVQGHLNPVALKEAVQTAIDEQEILRSAFFVKEGMLCQAVFPEYQMPDILCWNHAGMGADDTARILNAAMEGDMRQGLGDNEFFRLSAYQTGEDAYAVLVTAENILAENFDFRTIWGGDTLAEAHAASGKEAETDAAAYWDSLPPLEPSDFDLPFSKPGADGNLKTYRLTLPPNLTKELTERATGKREILLGALATAWALTLNEEGSAAFSDLTHGKTTVCPLLLTRQNTTTEKLVSDVARQLEESPRFSFALPPFPCNSLLSFAAFLREGGNYAKASATPDGQIIDERVWSPQHIPLSLYFSGNSDLSVLFLYEAERFKPFGVELLAKRYVNVLLRLSRDFRQPFLGFTMIYSQEEKSAATEPLRSSQSVFDLLHASSLLSEVTITQLKENLGGARLTSKLMGDRISGDALEQNVIYLAQGQVSVSLYDLNGWCNVLGLKKDDSWLNEIILLPQRSSKLALEIVSDAADLIYIPLAEFRRLLYNEPSAVRGMLLLALAEMEKYQKLWVSM